MPRAKRYFLPGHIWHITNRCHQKDFLQKFSKDRQRWWHWLFEANKRFGLCACWRDSLRFRMLRYRTASGVPDL